jgi:hypothetical protein
MSGRGGRSYNRPVQDRILPFAVSFAVTCVFFINVCDWIFDCGCRSLWAGADAMCNVHLANVHRCPICSRGIAGYAAVMIAVTAPQLAASVWLPLDTVTRIVLCLLLFPIGMIAVGGLLGLHDGYWAAFGEAAWPR